MHMHIQLSRLQKKETLSVAIQGKAGQQSPKMVACAVLLDLNVQGRSCQSTAYAFLS